MNEKFTPAPWQVFRKESSVGCKEGQGIAELWRDGDERKANAALIAAAPEMYEMLSKLSMQLTAINAHKAVNDIEQLLAKARGEV
jgi:two-component SAPR family response regulator